MTSTSTHKVRALASDLSGYVTGQTLVVDGGVGTKFPYPRPPSEDSSAD